MLQGPSPVPVAQAVGGCQAQQVIAGVVEEPGEGPDAVGGVLQAVAVKAWG